MTTAVPGLIKIGRTGTNNFEQRMYNLEHDGYRNVTALKRTFAIEVDDYSEKETMLHTIFEKSRVADTELFALDINIAVQLLSSFDGSVIYPKSESKADIFEDATDKNKSKLIPDGKYSFKRKKISDKKTVDVKAVIQNGRWTLLKGSIIGIAEDAGSSKKAKVIRAIMPIDSTGKLLEDFDLGVCSPSLAGNIVMNRSNNGWTDWCNSKGEPINIYRNKKTID